MPGDIRNVRLGSTPALKSLIILAATKRPGWVFPDVSERASEHIYPLNCYVFLLLINTQSISITDKLFSALIRDTDQ